jgi:hypothetical protein
MCFSAPASFIASGGLALLGGTSLAIAKKEDRLLAAIPFLFAIQQAFEGVQWLYLNAGSSSLFAGYVFLFFAFVVWPVYMPTLVYFLDTKKQKILKWFLILGVLVAFYYIGLLLTQSLVIDKLKSCVSYTFNYPIIGMNFVMVAYLVAVFGPMIVSSRKILKWFGIVSALLAFISWIFYSVNFTSVWCFFAAIVSSMFFIYIKWKNKSIKAANTIADELLRKPKTKG